ncbi:MAG: hypothetical protein JJU00_05365 [Opitutales bacterium]|nr:hypothetical protein [Opitutales bacterium]
MSAFRSVSLVIVGCVCGMGIYLWLGNENGEPDFFDPSGKGRVVDSYERQRDRSAPMELAGNSEPAEMGETDPSKPGAGFAGPGGKAREGHSHVIRTWRGHWEPSLAEMGERFQAGEERSFALPFFDGESHFIEVERFTEHRLGGSVLRGEVAGFPGSLVSLASVNGNQAGSIHIPSEGLVYEIRPGPDGTTILSEVDAAAMGECLTCLEPDTFTPPPESFPQPVAPPIR